MVKGCITKQDSCSSSKILPNSDPDKTQNIRINADKDGQKIQPQKVTIKVIPGKEKEIDFKVTVSLITNNSGCSPSFMTQSSCAL